MSFTSVNIFIKL